MRSCPRCNGKLVKYGFLKKENTQRYRCNKCRKLCSDAPNRTFGTLRTQPDKIVLVLRLLTEGMGIRAAARLANCHRDTVLRILKHAGQRSQKLLQKKLVDVPVKNVEADEIWTFVQRKTQGIDPEQDANSWGDFYIFLALESDTKLLLMPTIGKRNFKYTEQFAEDLRIAALERFQLTTDGFAPYRDAMHRSFGKQIDFAQFYKEHNMLHANKKKKANGEPVKNLPKIFAPRSGNPNPKRITTSHVERVNLSLRTFNRRFNRKTIGFSKDEENLAYSVYLFVAHYNFCREHSSLGRKTTPAMAQGLTDNVWKVEQLLNIRA